MGVVKMENLLETSVTGWDESDRSLARKPGAV